MIATGTRTGYEIKQRVDRSTRHFWAASYGQIYPELRQLEQEGLVRSNSEPSGARARTAYELTEAGERALREWLASDEELFYELRDEGMLKLFFSGVAPEDRLKNIRAMRALYQRKFDQLSALKAKFGEMATGPALTLEMGLTTTNCLIDWCEATERRLVEAEAEVEV
jgi:PadR family transcriptional regulator, regulatory protein AphA